MFYGLRLLSATRAFGVDCRVELVGVSLKEWGLTGSRRARRTVSHREETARHLLLLVLLRVCVCVCEWFWLFVVVLFEIYR